LNSNYSSALSFVLEVLRVVGSFELLTLLLDFTDFAAALVLVVLVVFLAVLFVLGDLDCGFARSERKSSSWLGLSTSMQG
jgi:hypothetical protein